MHAYFENQVVEIYNIVKILYQDIVNVLSFAYYKK